MTIQMKENPGVVETVIDMLNHISVDGETMEYILEKTGMEYQMLKKISLKDTLIICDFLGIEK
jgi:DNA-directed RNA polymerase subunit H (RpoH/RPB5)